MKNFEVIIIGGSFAGLSAALALSRSLRNVLVIDSDTPCNKPALHAHNLIAHDGEPPALIAQKAKAQLVGYKTVTFLQDIVLSALKEGTGFAIETASGARFSAKKLLFATGMADQLPAIPGFADCWGISILNCPYCHGYEVREHRTGILANGDAGFDLSKMVSHWTKQLDLFTNGPSTLTAEQAEILKKHGIGIIAKEIQAIEQESGQVKNLVFADGGRFELPVLYAKVSAVQQCDLPKALGCELTEIGLIKIDDAHKTTVPGVFAAGDNSTPYRALSVAIASGTRAGASINGELISEHF